MTVNCEACGQGFEAKRSTARFCSDTCRKRSERSSGAESGGRSFRAVYAELEAVGRLETADGQIALTLAEALDSGQTSGSAKAQLARELLAVRAKAMAGVKVADDPMDELKRLRDQKRGLA